MLQARRSIIPKESLPLAFPFISVAAPRLQYYLPEVHGLKPAIYMWCKHFVFFSEYTGISE